MAETGPTAPEGLLAFVRQAVPFWDTLGLELGQAAGGKSRFSMQAGPAHLQNGIIHGGVVASLLDSACALAALSLVWPADYASSVTLHVAYLRPVLPGRLTAQGECLKAGRTILFCEARAFDAAGELVATASSELMRVPRRGPTGS